MQKPMQQSILLIFLINWVTNRQSTVKMTWLQASAPQTYTYFEALEADGWS